MGVIPSWISAGAHRVEVMMNAAVVGKPMPRIMQHTIVRIMVGSLAPPETLSKMEVNFKSGHRTSHSNRQHVLGTSFQRLKYLLNI